jgi:hypothetical protein
MEINKSSVFMFLSFYFHFSSFQIRVQILKGKWEIQIKIWEN